MFVKFLPNQYVLRYKKGRLVQEGAGLSFRYFDKATSCCVVPLSGTDADFVFTEQTLDYQSVTVQGTVTYRVKDHKRIASLMDFTVDLRTGKYNSDPTVKLSKRMIGLSEVMVKKHVSGMSLTEAIKSGNVVADKIAYEIKKEEQLAHLGIEVVGFSILKISANSETTRALETGTREEILKQADIALYDRRNSSIEHERQVKENELNTEIKVEAKKKQIRQTEVETKLMLLEKENELKKIESAAAIELKKRELDAKMGFERRQKEQENELKKLESAAAIERERLELDAKIELERKRREFAELRLENAKKDADAEAYRLREIMKAYSSISPEVLVSLATFDAEPEKIIARAFEKLSAGSAKIGTLNITPDLLESLTGR